MYHDFTYKAVLASSLKVQWQLDDVLRADQELDFSHNFLPESLARTAAIGSLSPDEQRTLNQISAHQYICLFGTVEEIILPFLMDHARPLIGSDDWRIRALLNFASEEAKHIHLFNRFHEAFLRGFPSNEKLVGPSKAIAHKVLDHDPLAIGLLILMIEWMTQAHYLGSIKDSGEIDPLFKSLLKHHWMEEAQHAKLDTLIVDALAERRSEDERLRAINEFFQLVGIFDQGLRKWAALNVAAFEAVIGRTLADRDAIIAQQHQAARWTYLGSGMVNDRFKASVEAMSERGARRVAKVASLLT